MGYIPSLPKFWEKKIDPDADAIAYSAVATFCIQAFPMLDNTYGTMPTKKNAKP